MPGKALDETPRFDRHAFVRIRKTRRFSLDDVGRPLNISRHIIGGWEKGQTSPSASRLRAVAHVLMVDPSELLVPPNGEPTIGDLRMDRALTLDELANLSTIKRARLDLWERTGRLGSDDEHPLLLAALTGFSYDAIVEYANSGQIPQQLTRRLAHLLRVTPDDIQRAFDHTAQLNATTPQRIAA